MGLYKVQPPWLPCALNPRHKLRPLFSTIRHLERRIRVPAVLHSDRWKQLLLSPPKSPHRPFLPPRRETHSPSTIRHHPESKPSPRSRCAPSWSSHLFAVGADHNVLIRGDCGAEQKLCNAAGQIAAKWNKEVLRDPTKTKLTLEYDKVVKEAKWTQWMENREMEKGDEAGCGSRYLLW